MPKSTWVFAGLLSALVLIGGLGLSLRSVKQQAAAAEAAAAEAQQMAARIASLTNRLAEELSASKSEAEILANKVKETQEERLWLQQQMRAELESKDVAISQLQGRLTFNILDRVLFDSGKSTLKPEGEAILLKIGKFLSAVTNREVQVAGHTDNIPIHNRTPEGFTENWSLSAGRAIAAVRFLHEKVGISPKRLSAVGYGEYRPIASNDSNEGRARNRRIAVVVLPEQLPIDDSTKSDDSGTNRVPPSIPAPGTNATPVKLDNAGTNSPSPQ